MTMIPAHLISEDACGMVELGGRDRVLVVAAHPDDETLGCGGTIAKHARRGDAVSIVAMADGVGSRGGSMGALLENAKDRHGQFRRACKILGTEDVWLHQFPDNCMDRVDALLVAKQVEAHITRFRPTIVYTHSGADLNIDHRIVNGAVQVACRPQPWSTVRLLFYFEVLSSTEWGTGFRPDHFENITATLETKIKAITCYASELREFPHPRSVEGIRNQAAYRGMSVGVAAAEAFTVGRSIS